MLCIGISKLQNINYGKPKQELLINEVSIHNPSGFIIAGLFVSPLRVSADWYGFSIQIIAIRAVLITPTLYSIIIV